jgi:23S rRNA pseudouridine1911/1915/1917 synthase
MKGERLDVSLASMMPNYSRSKISSLIKSGDALIRGQKFKPKDKSNGDEVISLILKEIHRNQWVERKFH